MSSTQDSKPFIYFYLFYVHNLRVLISFWATFELWSFYLQSSKFKWQTLKHFWTLRSLCKFLTMMLLMIWQWGYRNDTYCLDGWFENIKKTSLKMKQLFWWRSLSTRRPFYFYMCTCAFNVHVHKNKLIELNKWKHIRVEQEWHFMKVHNYHSICTWVASTHVCCVIN